MSYPLRNARATFPYHLPASRVASNFTGMPITYNDSVASEVRAEMARQRVSQTTLAARLDWSQAFLSRRITGEVTWGADEIEAVANALGVPISQLTMPPAGAA
jgi:Cro/C1-type HTH DNA-binding domain